MHIPFNAVIFLKKKCTINYDPTVGLKRSSRYQEANKHPWVEIVE